jgi:hypothetical protein
MFDFLSSLILAPENFSLKPCIPDTTQTRLLYPFFPKPFLGRKILILQLPRMKLEYSQFGRQSCGHKIIPLMGPGGSGLGAVRIREALFILFGNVSRGTPLETLSSFL